MVRYIVLNFSFGLYPSSEFRSEYETRESCPTLQTVTNILNKWQCQCYPSSEYYIIKLQCFGSWNLLPTSGSGGGGVVSVKHVCWTP
jgi:hypothetical protein